MITYDLLLEFSETGEHTAKLLRQKISDGTIKPEDLDGWLLIFGQQFKSTAEYLRGHRAELA